MAKVPFLSGTAIDALAITGRDVMDMIEELLARRDRGTVWWADKSMIRTPDGRYMMSVMAAADDPACLVVKSLIVNDRNGARGLPALNGLIMVLDGDTGVPVATLDANRVTELRTPALSCVAALRLCRPDTSIAAFVGCGVQARSHLDAYMELFPLHTIRLFGRGRPNIDRLARLGRDRGLGVEICDSPRQAVEGADIVTSTITLYPPVPPFLDAGWLKPGACAVITDSSLPWFRETFGAFDRIIIDDMQQEAGMAKKLADPDMVSGDLADLVAGRTGGRGSPEERTAFNFRSHPVGDLAFAALAVTRAFGNSRGAMDRSPGTC
ncbi:MAG: ornithine cyclodeaminase family protein [Alphaproteobacteria bacterium]|nr:ornithine cyclodeaminase family protein [Alphaproteobacteria bacterium]